MNKKIIAILSTIIVLLGGAVATDTIQFGSVTQGNSYTATSTPFGGNWADSLLKGGQGSLAQVVITKAGDLEFNLYNATSTGAVANDPTFDKSSNLLATFPPNAAVGTYIFDAEFTDGLVIDVISGTYNSSTIMFR